MALDIWLQDSLTAIDPRTHHASGRYCKTKNLGSYHSNITFNNTNVDSKEMFSKVFLCPFNFLYHKSPVYNNMQQIEARKVD